jgi:hypothetical protein
MSIFYLSLVWGMDTSVESKEAPPKRKFSEREWSGTEEELWENARAKTFITGTGWGATFWRKPDHTARLSLSDRQRLSLNQQFFSRMTDAVPQDERGFICLSAASR